MRVRVCVENEKEREGVLDFHPHVFTTILCEDCLMLQATLVTSPFYPTLKCRVQPQKTLQEKNNKNKQFTN